MKVYPLIYSRTKLCDYLSDFLVRPSDIDYVTAAKYVGEALEEINRTDIRHAVFCAGNYVIYGGTACYTNDAFIERVCAEKGLRSLDLDYTQYRSDKVGRPLAFFIGFAVKRSELNGEIPDIDLYGTYKIYLDYLKHQWNEIYTKSELLNEGIDIRSKAYQGGFTPDTVSLGSQSFIRNYSEKSYQAVLDYYFNQCARSLDCSFLSNVYAECADRCKSFKNIGLYQKDADEYVRNHQSAPVTQQPNVTRTAAAGMHRASIYEKELSMGSQTPDIPQSDNNFNDLGNNGQKKTSSLAGGLAIGAVVLVILALVIALLIGLNSKDTVQSSPIFTENENNSQDLIGQNSKDTVWSSPLHAESENNSQEV